jgi:hypothetical protein
VDYSKTYVALHCLGTVPVEDWYRTNTLVHTSSGHNNLGHIYVSKVVPGVILFTFLYNLEHRNTIGLWNSCYFMLSQTGRHKHLHVLQARLIHLCRVVQRHTSCTGFSYLLVVPAFPTPYSFSVTFFLPCGLRTFFLLQINTPSATRMP